MIIVMGKDYLRKNITEWEQKLYARIYKLSASACGIGILYYFGKYYL